MSTLSKNHFRQNAFSAKRKIALFVGTDVIAHLVLNRLIPELVQNGYEPILYFPEHKIPKSKINAFQPELQELAYYERHLPSNVIYPIIEQTPDPATPNLSPRQLAEKYGLHIETVQNVNAPAFYEKISMDPNIFMGLSIRCFQIFSPAFITTFKNNGTRHFLNIHPGRLPDFKGVLSTLRAMEAATLEKKTPFQKPPSYGWTLHEMADDGTIDTGDIFYYRGRPIDLAQTCFLSNVNIADLGAQTISDALSQLDAGNILGHSQGHLKDTGYYTYPTPAELAEWKRKGIKIVDADEASNILIGLFSSAQSERRTRLTKEIERAINIWRLEQENKKKQLVERPAQKRPSPNTSKLTTTAPKALAS